MKQILTLLILASLIACDAKKGIPNDGLFKTIVYSHYKYLPDEKPGREILIQYIGPIFQDAQLDIRTSNNKEILQLACRTQDLDSLLFLLPAGFAVLQDEVIDIHLTINNIKQTQTLTVPAQRQWTVYIYPHSHVDIGYTNTHQNVELIHTRNLTYGMDLAEQTKNYPEGARYIWNPEVSWPIEKYLNKATPQERDRLISAIKAGYIAVDAGYIHTNTSAASDEELLAFFKYSKKIEKLTDTKVETLVQVDIPGVSWGLVTAAAHNNISYVLALYNGDGRTGNGYEQNFRPSWWLGPDGESKVLFLQPGSYNPGEHAKGHQFWPLMAGQLDSSKLLKVIKTDNPRDNFVDKYLSTKLPELEQSDYYPYDIFAMSWAMADNTPIDADLPDAVKSWNEEFAFPKLIISSATQMMRAFDEKYGSILPTISGDYTEYWTDGLGSAAKQTGRNRNVKEQLIQTETLWSMLRSGEPAPEKEFEDAWRNVILGTEHTWAYMDPNKQPIQNDILSQKFGFFENADKQTMALLNRTLPKSDASDSLVAVFNTLSWVRSGLIILPNEMSKNYSSVFDLQGKKILSQRLSTGELAFWASDIPALSSAIFRLSLKKIDATDGFAKGNSLDNGLTKIHIDPKSGDISSMICNGQEFVSSQAINTYSYIKGSDSINKALKPSMINISIKENGPLLSTLLITSHAPGCKKLTREISLTAEQPQVSISNIVNKLAVEEKEGIHFGFAFDVPNPVIKVDIPWAVMDLETDQIKGANRNWIAFQRWLDISNAKYGVTWCALDACMFESGDIRANVLGMATRSPQWIHRLEPSSTVYSWALNNHWFTNFPLSQQGEIPFRYRILPHNSAYDIVQSNRFGMEQVQPLIASKVNVSYQITKPNLELKGTSKVMVSVIKTINQGMSNIVRLRSISSVPETIDLIWNKQPKSIYFCKGGQASSKQITSKNITVSPMGYTELMVNY